MNSEGEEAGTWLKYIDFSVVFQGQPKAFKKDLSGKSHREKLPFPHQICAQPVPGSLWKELESGLWPPGGARLVCLSAFLALAEAFLRAWYQEREKIWRLWFVLHAYLLLAFCTALSQPTVPSTEGAFNRPPWWGNSPHPCWSTGHSMATVP